MATITWSGASGVSGNIVFQDFTQRVNGSSFAITMPSTQVRGTLVNVSTQTWNRYYYFNNVYVYCRETYPSTSLGYLPNATDVHSNVVGNSTVYATIPSNALKSNRSSGDTSVFPTSWFFNSNNPTSRSVAVTFESQSFNGTDGTGVGFGSYDNGTSNFKSFGTLTLTLDVPPSGTVSNISYDTSGYIYAGLTTASVDISNLTAYYGGTITDVTLKIGNQTVSRTDNGTLSILLNAVGTFTPTVTVTDSRGQTTTKTFDPITVNGYVAPAVSFTADRTLSSGVPDDEGGYATVNATFTYTDVVASLVAPSVVLTDENGTQTTPVVTWYTTRASDGTLSGTLSDWSNVARGDTVYGLIPNVNTQYSYQISIRPRDTEGTGTAITQTLSSAFYTVDFLAGGHGIAFGKPALNVGFECAMDATFEETLTAQDMTQQEVDDFVDNLDVTQSAISFHTTTYTFTNLAQYSPANYYLYISGIKAKAGIPSTATIISASMSEWSGLGTTPNVHLANADSIYITFQSGWSVSSASYMSVYFVYILEG